MGSSSAFSGSKWGCGFTFFFETTIVVCNWNPSIMSSAHPYGHWVSLIAAQAPCHHRQLLPPPGPSPQIVGTIMHNDQFFSLVDMVNVWLMLHPQKNVGLTSLGSGSGHMISSRLQVLQIQLPRLQHFHEGSFLTLDVGGPKIPKQWRFWTWFSISI